MDKLTNIQIDGDKLTFKIETEVDLSSYSKEVYIDEVWNLKNILEDSPIHNISFSENITVDSENNVPNKGRYFSSIFVSIMAYSSAVIIPFESINPACAIADL